MKTGTWTLIVIVLLCINSIMLFLLWHKRPGHARPQQDPRNFLVQELSLTPAQSAKFDSLRSRHHHTIDSLSNAQRLLKDSLFNNLGKPAGAKTINRLTTEIGQNTALIDETTFYHFREVRNMLSNAQKQKFDSIIKQVLRMMATQAPGPEGRHTGAAGPPQGDPRPGGPGPNGPPPGN